MSIVDWIELLLNVQTRRSTAKEVVKQHGGSMEEETHFECLRCHSTMEFMGRWGCERYETLELDYFLVYRCPACGKVEFFEFVLEEIECPECGATIKADQEACPSCGWTWERKRDSEGLCGGRMSDHLTQQPEFNVQVKTGRATYKFATSDHQQAPASEDNVRVETMEDALSGDYD